MTGNFHVAQSLMQKVLNTQGYAWVQLLLASVYSGAFHPSAEGQAAIADAVVDKARAVLAKYEARAARRPSASISGSADQRRAVSCRLSPIVRLVASERSYCAARTRESVLTLVRTRGARPVAAQCTTARSARDTAAPIR